jgi:NAD(P)-dependent dehydrogenase (short-subunit alcohol dehydrogenase family)
VTNSAQEFHNKSILVTGGGRGIGKRLALGFARLGARIALVARSKAELDLTHIEIEQNGGSALRIRGDVNDPEQMAVATDRVRVAYGAVPDVLICAAGVAGPLRPFLKCSLKQWTEALHVNLLGTINSCRAVLPGMVERRHGKVIVLVCNADIAPKLHFSSYSTAKTAAVRFVESIAAEIADRNVQINCFDPGQAYTSLTDEIIQAGEKLEPKVVSDALETRTTGGTSPDQQMKVAEFLASEASNHVTGRLIHVDDDWKKLKNATLRRDAYTLRRHLR